MKKQKSNCCNAPVKVGGDVTHFYVCTRCNRACDLADDSDKSYVTLGICPICKNETGELILDRRLKPTFKQHTIIPYSVCDNCKKTYLSVGVMLIDPKTGALCVIRDEAYEGLFKRPIPKNKIAYCNQNVLDKIDELKKRSEKPEN